jgi:spoIIIJ-associated protein
VESDAERADEAIDGSADDGGTELPDAPGERVAAIIDRVLDELDLDADVEVDESDEEILAAIDGEDDLGILIGRRGQTLDALQLICYRAAFQGRSDRKRVTVDAAGYRERRRELLGEEAEIAAERASRNGEPVRLEPMSASERRMVHDVLKDRGDVETFSEGDEPDRRVVVAPLIPD